MLRQDRIGYNNPLRANQNILFFYRALSFLYIPHLLANLIAVHKKPWHSPRKFFALSGRHPADWRGYFPSINLLNGSPLSNFLFAFPGIKLFPLIQILQTTPA